MVVTQAGHLIPAPLLTVIEQRAIEAGGISELAGQLGVDEARVRRIGRGLTRGDGRALQTGLVTVAGADAWLTRLGAHIADVYGPLYGLGIPETDACGDDCLACGLPLREPAELCGFCLEEGVTS